METIDLLREKMDKLAEFESRITVLENQLRDRQYSDLLTRVKRLEQLQREGRLHRGSDESPASRSW